MSTKATRTKQAADLSTAAPIIFIRLSEVERRLGRSRWWIRQEILAGRFPKPVNFGTRFPAWDEAEITSYQRAALEAPDERGAE